MGAVDLSPPGRKQTTALCSFQIFPNLTIFYFLNSFLIFIFYFLILFLHFFALSQTHF